MCALCRVETHDRAQARQCNGYAWPSRAGARIDASAMVMAKIGSGKPEAGASASAVTTAAAGWRLRAGFASREAASELPSNISCIKRGTHRSFAPPPVGTGSVVVVMKCNSLVHFSRCQTRDRTD